MIGILPERISESERYWANKIAEKYTSVAAAIGETIHLFLKKKAPRIPRGAFRNVKCLFDNARRYIINTRRYLMPSEGREEYTLIRDILKINQNTSRGEDLKISRRIRSLDSLTQRLAERNSIPAEEKPQYKELLNFYKALMERGLEAGEISYFMDESDDDPPTIL
jgi:hypothetical protein